MGKFDVGIAALRQDARIWDEQSSQLTTIARKIADLRMDRAEAGIFQIFVSAYQAAVDQVIARSTEGSAAMTAVATTLTEVANAYQRDESGETYRFQDLY
jgi:hypothetical protein